MAVAAPSIALPEGSAPLVTAYPYGMIDDNTATIGVTMVAEETDSAA